jgi:hypothetical protein
MIEKVKIKGLEIRSGISKKGRGYDMVLLETDSGKLSMYLDKEWGAKKLEIVDGWKEGDEVTVSIEQNGEYLNFDIPTKTDLLEQRLSALELRLEEVELVIKNAKRKSN